MAEWKSSVKNLEWCTREQNLKHEHSTDLGDKAKAGLRRSFLERRKPVIAISKKDGRRLKFESIQETGRQLGVHATKVCACLNGKRKSTGGYVFDYKEEK